jgi:hypothetical protein
MAELSDLKLDEETKTASFGDRSVCLGNARAPWELLTILHRRIGEPCTQEQIRTELSRSPKSINWIRRTLDRQLWGGLGIRATFTRGVGYQLELADSGARRDYHRPDQQFRVWCDGRERIGLADLCQQFANGLEIPGKLTADEAGVFVLHQFEIAVADELRALVVKCD